MWTNMVAFSLGRRIVASVAFGLALVLLLFGLVVLWTIQESREAAYRERVTLAEALAGRVDDVLRYALATLEREATALQIEPGQPLTDDQRHRLVDLRHQLGIFALISVADADGNVLWVDPRASDLAIGASLDHPGVQLAIASGEAQIAEFVSRGESESAFACLTVPLRDLDGRLAGALMARLDLGHPALNLLPSGEMGDGIHAQLMNTAGRLLAGLRWPAGSGVIRQHQLLLDKLMVSRTPGYIIHQPRSPSGPDSHLVAYAPVPLLPSWGVVVEQPRDLVLAMPRRLQERLILLGFVALLFAGAVAWYDVRRVVRPLKQLTATAERFAAGQLDEAVHLHRTDELGILARAFETMRQRLRASMAEVAEWNRELEKRVAARTAEVERRNRELAHLNAIAATVSGSLEVRAMLERTLERVLQIAGAEVGCFRTTEGHGDQLVLAAEHCLPANLRDESLPDDGDRCLCWRAVHLRRVVVAGEDDRDLDSVACRRTDLMSALAVPLPAGEQVQGVLFLGSSHPNRFQQEQLATLGAIGRQVGIALANARLYQNLRARERERAELLQRVMDGQEEERRRLAQELHDETSQALASLQIGLERLAAGVADSQHARQLAVQLQGVAAQTLEDVHRLAVELRPSVLDDLGLVAAIGRYLQEGAERRGLVIDFASVGVDRFRLIPAAETAIYRIVQAAVTNVVQHGRARHASVLLERRDGKLVVVVDDDGRGFDLAAVRAAPLEMRLGLAGMEERASLIGATLTIETTSGTGSTIFLEVPLDPNCRREDATDVEVADPVG